MLSRINLIEKYDIPENVDKYEYFKTFSEDEEVYITKIINAIKQYATYIYASQRHYDHNDNVGNLSFRWKRENIFCHKWDKTCAKHNLVIYQTCSNIMNQILRYNYVTDSSDLKSYLTSICNDDNLLLPIMDLLKEHNIIMSIDLESCMLDNSNSINNTNMFRTSHVSMTQIIESYVNFLHRTNLFTSKDDFSIAVMLDIKVSQLLFRLNKMMNVMILLISFVNSFVY